MKRSLILTAFFVCTSLAALCQLDRGNWLAGGQVVFDHERYEVDNNTSKAVVVSVSPALGYFVLDRLATGVRAGFSTTKNTWYGGEVSRQQALSLAPFARYYFLPEAERVNLFAEASYQFRRVKFRNPYERTTQEATGYTVLAGPAFFLNRHVALQLTLGYSYSKWDEHDRAYSIESGLGLEIHLGKERGK